MRIWDSMCATVLSTGARRGAMMATLRCDHPDVEDFIDAKHEDAQLRHFNLSVLISDEFMQALNDGSGLAAGISRGASWTGPGRRRRATW